MNLENHLEYKSYRRVPRNQGVEESREFYNLVKSRRTIRQFNDKKIPREILDNALRAAGSAPSGANKQPWFFAVIEDQGIKKEIRKAAESVEDSFYNGRAGEDWLEDLKPFSTNAHKPYLEEASTIIAVFAKTKDDGGGKTYYPVESTCLATGILLTALHSAGVATLTHTPRPMNFLGKILGLESFYKPLILLVAGYPKEPILVPKIERKRLEEIAKYY